MAHVTRQHLAGLLLGGLLACGGTAEKAPSTIPAGQAMTGAVRVGYLHHSTGGVVWGGGVQTWLQGWNAAHGTGYRIAEVTYPSTAGGYPWANYPYDYWNLWVSHTGSSRDRGEANLDDLAASHDVIVWKHCFPVSGIGADTGSASVSSEVKTAENYKLQYQALKARMRQFPDKRFLVWTGAALRAADTDAASAQRARDFFAWVKSTWDEPGDNIFVWDFFELETQGGNVLAPAYATGDSHPNGTLAALAAPLVGKRIVDVIEGRGDSGSLTGQ
ncbi:MAG: hypothetical protein HZB56_02895 [Deltaproteobacteria bacterium]|nr:hypothetical protein [Deltaproteobacteria bacterium]